MLLGGELVLETVNLIEEGEVATIKQTETNSLKNAPKLTKENTKIDWSLSVEKIDAFIRGLNPYPAAWSTLYNNKEELKVKIYNTNFEIEKHTLEIGKVVSTKKEMKIPLRTLVRFNANSISTI